MKRHKENDVHTRGELGKVRASGLFKTHHNVTLVDGPLCGRLAPSWRQCSAAPLRSGCTAKPKQSGGTVAQLIMADTSGGGGRGIGWWVLSSSFTRCGSKRLTDTEIETRLVAVHLWCQWSIGAKKCHNLEEQLECKDFKSEISLIPFVNLQWDGFQSVLGFHDQLASFYLWGKREATNASCP